MTTLRELNNMRLEKLAADTAYLTLGSQDLASASAGLQSELNKVRIARELQAEYGPAPLMNPDAIAGIINERETRRAKTRALATAALGGGAMMALNPVATKNPRLVLNRAIPPKNPNYGPLVLGKNLNTASVAGMAGVGLLAQRGTMSPEDVDKANLALATVGTVGGVVDSAMTINGLRGQYGNDVLKNKTIKKLLSKNMASAAVPLAAYAAGKLMTNRSKDEVDKLTMLGNQYSRLSGTQPALYQ